MITMKKRIIWMALCAVANIHAKPFTIMTLNTYAWPETLNAATKALLSKELASGITKPIGQRIDGIGNLITQKKPDIVVFQELWGINNKKRMIKAMGCNKRWPYVNPSKFDCENALYPYNVLDDTSNLDYARTKSLVDSGLMISSRFPIVRYMRITFPEKLDEEQYANKGALFALIKTDDVNRPYVLVVNTHLQSGSGVEFIQVRERQMQQIAREIKNFKINDPRMDDPRIIIIGDFNDPIKYIGSQKLLTDRTGFMIKALRDNGVLVSNEQVKNILIKHLGAQEVADINEIKRDGTIYSTADGKKLRTLGNTDPLVQRLSPDPAQGTYFKYATDNPGIQLLDHIFVDDKSKILNYQVLRKEVLHDPMTGGTPTTYDPTTALTDHAAIMATIE